MVMQSERLSTLMHAHRGSSLVRLAMLAIFVSVAGCQSFGRCGMRGCPDDQQITAHVRELLDQYPALAAPSQVTVQTVNHVIYLRGLVATPYQKRLAAYLAGQIDVPVRVVNLIGLDNGSR